MEETRICPSCGAEYYSHITHCADCNIDLTAEYHEEVDPGEIIPGEAVVAAKGPIMNLKPLIGLLESGKIAHQVKVIDGERTVELTPGTEFGIYIKPEDAEKVLKLVTSMSHQEFPELGDAENQLEAGQCPACGAETSGEKECPDCGLPLWIEDEDENDSE